MMHPLQLNLFLHSLRMIFLLIFGLIPCASGVKYTRASRQSVALAGGERAPRRSLSLSRTCPCDSRARLSARRRAPAQSSNSFVRCVVARECECSCLARNRRFFSSSFRLSFTSSPKSSASFAKGSFAGMTFAQNARVVSHQVIINRRSRSSSSQRASPLGAREASARTIHPRVSIHASREFDTARASNDRSFSRPSRVDASRPETRLATRRPDLKPRGEGSIAFVARSSSDAAR